MNTKRFLNKTFQLEIYKSPREYLPIASFVFSVPAQDENFSYQQRIAETKTFGGVIFDNYGNDSIKIHISGSTINQELRTVYNGAKGNFNLLSGQEEIFLLQDIITKNNKDIAALSEQVMRLYDLGSSQYWDGLISDLEIKRSKDNPLAYNYSFSFIGNPPGTSIPKEDEQKAVSFVDDMKSKIDNFCSSLRKGSDLLYSGLGYLSKATDLIATLNNAIDSVENEMLKYSKVLGNYTAELYNLVDDSVSLGANIISSAKRIIVDTGMNLYNASKNLSNSVRKVHELVDNIKSAELPPDLFDNYINMGKDWVAVAQEAKDSLQIIADDMDKNSNAISEKVKQNVQNIGIAVIPGNDATNDKTITTYGFKTHIIKSSDTWDRLALDYLGDSKYSTLLSVYNASQGIKNLTPGLNIQIPLLEPSENNLSNKIFSTPDNRDNYGKDILIESKDFGTSQNDFAISEGTQTLGQAINNRLTTTIGGRVRLVSYGLRKMVGESSFIESYIMSSINQTLEQEPRIKNIENVKFVGKGESLNINILYTDINETQQSFGGRF